MTHITQRHPPAGLLLDGSNAGRDVSVVIALVAITTERSRQERLATHPDAGS